MNIEFTNLIIPAFAAGLITFLAPCSFPLIPAYLTFISGVDPSLAASNRKMQWLIFLNSLFYILGFSLVFIAFGAVVGGVGGSFALIRRILAVLGGGFVVLLGIFGILNIRFGFWSNRLPVFLLRTFRRGDPTGSFLLGSAFAVGWTPCVGPILASVLLLASTSGTAFQGAILLSIFSSGLAIPFLAIGLGAGIADRIIERNIRFFTILRLVGNIMLIGLGILLVTDNFTLLIKYGFWILDFLNYKAIIKYL